MQTAVEAHSGGRGQIMQFDASSAVYQIGQAANRGEVAAAVNQGNAQTEQRIRRLVRQGALAS
jgi:hypothetical protein